MKLFDKKGLFSLIDSVKNESNKYFISYQDDKREVEGTSYEDLVNNIKAKFGLKNEEFRIEYWSLRYQEWILMESLPENESKLQLYLEKKENEPTSLKELIKSEVQKQLELSSNFAESLNSSFRKYIETDDTEYLKHFEVAVIFACKRREQKQYVDLEDFMMKNFEQQKLLKQLSDEMKKFQQTNKQFKIQLESLSTKIENVEINVKTKNKNKLLANRNNKCIII